MFNLPFSGVILFTKGAARSKLKRVQARGTQRLFNHGFGGIWVRKEPLIGQYTQSQLSALLLSMMDCAFISLQLCFREKIQTFFHWTDAIGSTPWIARSRDLSQISASFYMRLDSRLTTVALLWWTPNHQISTLISILPAVVVCKTSILLNNLEVET